jgi:hypothetical protein
LLNSALQGDGSDKTAGKWVEMMNNYRKADLFSEIVQQVHAQKPKERRPYIALATTNYTRAEAVATFGTNITRYEWYEAGKHAQYPGPLKPVEVIKWSRASYTLEELECFLGYVEDNFIQNHAYGTKEHVMASGAIVQLDAVSTTANTGKIMRDYTAAANDSNDTSIIENRCKKRCPKTNTQCMLSEGHEDDKRCKFTPHGCVSASTIHKVLGGLTKGSIKSLAGLDDEDTLKGGNSIETCLGILDVLSVVLGLQQHEISDMKKRINACLIFHKTDFVTHLCRNGERVCQCVSCGLHGPDGYIPCPIREDELHKGPCDDCEGSFEAYDRLLELSQRAQNMPNLSPEQSEQYHASETLR